jgi:hypothetical protein
MSGRECKADIPFAHALTPSHRHNNLPEMLVGFHVLEGLADVVELENLVDRQLQLARLDGAPDVLADLVKNLVDFVDAGCGMAPEHSGKG